MVVLARQFNEGLQQTREESIATQPLILKKRIDFLNVASLP
ncbi:MAG: hypothetical protein ACE5Q6_05100 [Dehalococcoidia bacterium]